jgi:hypothetical protein
VPVVLGMSTIDDVVRNISKRLGRNAKDTEPILKKVW